MQLTLKDDLPFVSITMAHIGHNLIIDDVLVDTGSGSTILAAHAVAMDLLTRTGAVIDLNRLAIEFARPA